MKREDAVKINEHIETMISIANDVLYIGNNSGDDGNREIIRDVLANVVTALDFDILEPIYKQYPDLRPPNLEELK